MSAVPVTAASPIAPASGTSKDPDAHAAHSSHHDALRLRAVSLWCEGLRSPAISKQLGIPERTVRAWLAEARADFQAEHGESAHELIALAVERQLAIAAAAWTSYHHVVECEQLALDYYHAGLNRTAALKNIDDELPPPPPRPSTAPARYLSVALSAQREAARLSGCYDLAKALAARQVQPHPRPLSYAETRGLDPADERAWDGFLRQMGLSAARFAGPADLDPLYRPAWEALRRKLHALPPAGAATATVSNDPLSAETATAPLAPPSLWGTARAEGSDEKERSGRQAHREGGWGVRSNSGRNGNCPGPYATGSRRRFPLPVGTGTGTGGWVSSRHCGTIGTRRPLSRARGRGGAVRRRIAHSGKYGNR